MRAHEVRPVGREAPDRDAERGEHREAADAARQHVALAQMAVLEVLREVALEHAFGRIARIVIDRDLGAGRIALERRLDVEAAFVADANARAVNGAAAGLELVFDRRHVLHRLRLALELVAPRLDAGAQDTAGGGHPVFRLTQLDQLAGDGHGEQRDHRQEDQPDPEQIVLGIRNVCGDGARAPALDGEWRPGQRGDGDDGEDRRQRRRVAAAPAQGARIGHEFWARRAWRLAVVLRARRAGEKREVDRFHRGGIDRLRFAPLVVAIGQGERAVGLRLRIERGTGFVVERDVPVWRKTRGVERADDIVRGRLGDDGAVDVELHVGNLAKRACRQ